MFLTPRFSPFSTCPLFFNYFFFFFFFVNKNVTFTFKGYGAASCLFVCFFVVVSTFTFNFS